MFDVLPLEVQAQPVRTRAEPYGCKSNDEGQQKECDRGTVMMARSTQIAEEIAKTPTTSIVVKPVTVENPPPSEHEDHLSAWGVAEMVRSLRLPGVKITLLNTCVYQADRARGDRHWFGGALFGIDQMNASCKRGNSKHKAIIGKKASQESGEYPWALCNKYVHLLMDHFEKMATAEFLEGRMKELEQFHDGLSSGDAAATEMRLKRRSEGVKVSPSPEPGSSRRSGNLDTTEAELPQRIRDEFRGGKSPPAKDRNRERSERRAKGRSRERSSSARRGRKRPRSASRENPREAREEASAKKDLSWKACCARRTRRNKDSTNKCSWVE